MPFRFRRRRLARHGRGPVAAAAVLLLTSGAVAAVATSQPPSHGANASVARPAALPASGLQSGDSVAPPDDIEAPDANLAELPSTAPATAPAFPGVDDPRLWAIPHFPALTVEAGQHAVNVPILMYHFLRVDRNPNDALGWRLSVTPQNFALQMALLKREGYTSVGLGDVLDAIESGKQLPARPIVLTFDDGYANFATVGVPVLKAAGFTATDFVVSGVVGRPGFMTADQIRSVVAQGMTIGAHTIHHVDLSRVSPSVAWQEIVGSRAALQTLSGQRVTDFAYPSGQFDQRVIELVQQAGFRDAVTTISGFTHAAGLDYVMTRVRVSGGESLLSFAQSLGAPRSPSGVQIANAIPSPTPTGEGALAEEPADGGRGVWLS